MTEVDVSVVIPTFRREKLVVEAIKSALGQPGVTLEVFVLDDSPEGSAREAVEGIGDARVLYMHRARPSGGRPAVVRNEGARLARGTFLHFLDDDDRLAEGALAALVGALERRRAGVAFGTVTPFGEDPAVLEQQREYFRRAAALARRRWTRFDMTACLLFKPTCFVNSACMVRREVALSIGGYDSDLSHCEDAEFYMRAIRASGFVFVDREILHYRTGAPSLMHDLKGDRAQIGHSYGIAYRKYRRTHGPLEFYALKALSKVLGSRPTPGAHAAAPPADRASTSSTGKAPAAGTPT